MNPAPPSIRLTGISKAFGKVQANRDITLDIVAGQIHALLGENGAGKSTLMSILAGRIQPDHGQIFIDDLPVSFDSAKDAIASGIGMVYQHFMLVEALTVAENIFLGQEPGVLLNGQAMDDRILALGQRYGLQVDPKARVSCLSMGEKQRVEILKLLLRDSRVLVFDEPTTVLTPVEIDQLFMAFKQMAAMGKAIVFITHKLAEVMSIADQITIIRQGRVVDHLPASGVHSKADLAERMVGREVLLQVDRLPMEPRQRVLRISGLCDDVLQDIHLDLRQGEILAIVGVAGNGQKNLVEIVCGLSAPVTGSVSILGDPWDRFFKERPMAGKLSYIPEDRLGLATCPGLDLVDNFLLTTRHDFAAGPWLRRRPADKKIAQLIDTFGIHPPNRYALARQLSGGNLQKLVLAREFYRAPRLIVAEQPTQGLDIGATEEVWHQLLKARDSAGVLLITGDLNEALSLADRIVVMYRGRIMGEFNSQLPDVVEQIGPLMAGIEDPPITAIAQ
ncbi:MAG: ABC transporter ATP-binding protein [Pseudomonadota bacterium]